MAKEAIQAIFTAEEEAAKLLAEAREQASLVQKNLSREANELISELRNQAEGEIKKLLAEAQTKAENEFKPLLDEAETKAATYRDVPDEKMQEAVDYLLEQVSKYGNS